MSAAGVVIAGGGVLLHLGMGRWLASSWVIPDVTWLSLFFVMVRSPSPPPVSVAVVTALFVMAVTPQHPLPAGLAYLSVGRLVWVLASRVDVTNRSSQLAIVGTLEALLLGLWLVLGGTLTGSLLGLSGCKFLMTMAGGWGIQQALPRLSGVAWSAR